MSASSTRDKLDKLCKWRTLLAGWQLGTRTDTDPEAAAVKDQRELLLLLRVEMSALVRAAISEGVISQERWADLLGEEAEALDAMMSERFPGITTSPDGLVMTKEAVETMRKLNFKP